MPQAIERSLATPMMRPCFPAITAILISFRRGSVGGDRAGAPRGILHEAGRPGEQPPDLLHIVSAGLPGLRRCSFNEIRRIGSGMQQTENNRRAGFIGALHERLVALATFSRYALHRFNRDGCFAASGALSYTTLVSLVPLGVIALGILSVFPNFATLRQDLLAFIFRNFVPQISEQAAFWFTYFAGSAAQATAIGIIGIAATGILLLVTVEDQLNALWRVTTPRPWGQRVVAYWTLMTLGPLLVGMSLTLSTYL